MAHPAHPTRPLARALLAALPLFAAAVAALGGPGPALAAKPCAEQVLGDWWDNGRIDRLYPLHCYEEAIDIIPSDLRDYADADEVITRALQFALRGKLDPRGGPDPTRGEGDQKGGQGRTPAAPAGGEGSEAAPPTVDASGPSSLPIPLLVLGGMSLALLAAGGVGYLSRRRQGDGLDEPGDDASR
ncbi:MAG TPA: hypothetical protein VNM66_04565 [Thermodesulfobacteriota bacterium]|nr:hypothetical protein [Thermodesulfobacteriota bacterium]